MYKAELIVRPRTGVRDPQGSAVEEALTGLGYEKVHVHCVGRYLSMELDVSSEEEAKELATDMCRRLLVNPNLETFDLTINKV